MDFLTVAMRSFPEVSMHHSSVSPGCKFRNSAIPSGTVALRDFDFGRAIDVLLLSGMCILWFQCYLFLPMCWQRSLYTVSCIVYIGRCIWQHKF